MSRTPTKQLSYNEQQHAKIHQLGELICDFMFARYGKDKTREAHQQKLIKLHNSIDFNFFPPPQDKLNIHHVIGHYAHQWFTKHMTFGHFAKSFYHYLSQGRLAEEYAKNSAQLMAALGHAIDFAPKELFNPPGYLEKENNRREKLKQHFIPLLILIDLAPTWKRMLEEKSDENSIQLAKENSSTEGTPATMFFRHHSTTHQEYKRLRDEFVGEQEDESLYKAEADGAVSTKAKALIDFITKKSDFKTMKKVITVANETLQEIQYPDLHNCRPF